MRCQDLGKTLWYSFYEPDIDEAGIQLMVSRQNNKKIIFRVRYKAMFICSKSIVEIIRTRLTYVQS